MTTLLRRCVKNAMRYSGMRIACPNCQTLYDVPDDLLVGHARRLRCEQCGHGWRLAPEAAQPPAPQGDEDTVITQMPAPDVSEALNRRFGEAADARAMAEIRAAMKGEALAHHEIDPAPQPALEAAPELPPQFTPDPAPNEEAELDRFADLVRAARNNQVELEPEKSLKRLPRASNPRLVVLLGLLIFLALIVVERHAVMRMLPASAKLFHALHLA